MKRTNPNFQSETAHGMVYVQLRTAPEVITSTGDAHNGEQFSIAINTVEK